MPPTDDITDKIEVYMAWNEVLESFWVQKISELKLKAKWSKVSKE